MFECYFRVQDNETFAKHETIEETALAPRTAEGTVASAEHL